MKKITILSMIILSIIITSSCSNTKSVIDDASKGLDFSNSDNERKNESQEQPVKDENFSSFAEDINPINISKIGETVKLEDIELSYTKVHSSKSLPNGISKDKIKYFNSIGETIDEQGNLTSGHTYIFIEIDITNLSNAPKEVNLSGLGKLRQLDESYAPISPMIMEARYVSNADKSVEDKDYFNTILQANEDKSFTIGYIVDDSIINENNLYYVLDNQENLKAYKVELNRGV